MDVVRLQNSKILPVLLLMPIGMCMWLIMVITLCEGSTRRDVSSRSLVAYHLIGRREIKTELAVQRDSRHLEELQ